MRAYEPQGAGGRREDDRRKARRLPRRGEHGPIGFSSVLANVRRRTGQGTGGHAGALVDAAGRDGVLAPTPSATSTLTVPTALALDRLYVVHSARTDPALAGVATQQAGQLADASLADGAQRMAPQQALQAVVDEARDMNAETDSRELVILLEPEHLGPLVVKIRIERGRVKTELNAREERAARLLGAGAKELEQRLRELGFAAADVAVEQRSAAYFTEGVGAT